jgi:transposase-like zinc-binding protein
MSALLLRLIGTTSLAQRGASRQRWRISFDNNGKAFSENNRSWLTYQHLRVLHRIEHCRTAALGGHIDGCSRCGYRADIS